MLLQSCQSWFGLPDYNPITVNAACLSPNNVGFVWFLFLGCCFVMFCVRLIWLHCVVYWTCGGVRMFWLWVSVWLSAHSGNGQCDKRIVKSFHCQPISEHCMYVQYTLYIVRPSLHNVCILSHGPTVTSSVHNTLLANKIRGILNPHPDPWAGTHICSTTSRPFWNVVSRIDIENDKVRSYHDPRTGSHMNGLDF